MTSTQGDSGGPLMSSYDGVTWSLVGVVSWGKRCGLKGVSFNLLKIILKINILLLAIWCVYTID